MSRGSLFLDLHDGAGRWQYEPRLHAVWRRLTGFPGRPVRTVEDVSEAPLR